jgi:hypothetical protein
VAGAEPPTVVTSTVADWHTTKVRTHPDHHQPFAGFIQRAVFIGSVCAADVAVPSFAIKQVAKLNGARSFNFFGCAAANEHGLAQEQNANLRSFNNARNVHLNGGQSLYVRGWVHLVNKGPNPGANRDSPHTSGGVVEKIPTSVGLIVCV